MGRMEGADVPYVGYARFECATTRINGAGSTGHWTQTQTLLKDRQTVRVTLTDNGRNTKKQ